MHALIDASAGQDRSVLVVYEVTQKSLRLVAEFDVPRLTNVIASRPNASAETVLPQIDQEARRRASLQRIRGRW